MGDANYLRYMDIQRLLTNLDDEFDNTTNIDLAEEISSSPFLT